MLLLPTRVPHRRLAGRAGYWSWLLVDLVVVAVAQTRPPLGTNADGPADVMRSPACGRPRR
jgi:hypothetical protein